MRLAHRFALLVIGLCLALSTFFFQRATYLKSTLNENTLKANTPKENTLRKSTLKESTLKETIHDELVILGHSTNAQGRISSATQAMDPDILSPPWNRCRIDTDVQKMCLDLADRDEISISWQCDLAKLAKDCGMLRKVHGYDDKPVEAEELEFPLAFGIKMHTDPEQVEQLLRTIYRPHNVYCIHVDLAAEYKVMRIMEALVRCLPNVYLTHRLKYFYAGIETLDIERLLMHCVLTSKVKWTYYINLSGQEFPLRTNLEMVRMFSLYNGTNDIETIPMPEALMVRIQYVMKRGYFRPWPTDVKKPPPPFPMPHDGMRKGSQYNAFTRDFVEFFMTSKLVKKMLGYYADTYSPDETIYANLVALPGTPGGYPVYVYHTQSNDHMSRAVVWNQTDSYICQGEIVRGICIFNMRDLPWLLQQPNIIANKFRLDMGSTPVLQCLEAILDQRARSRVITVSQSFIKNLPHVKYRSLHP